MKYSCPECQKVFNQTPILEEFTTQCPHCNSAVSIPADQEKVDKLRKETEEKAAAEKQATKKRFEEYTDRVAAQKTEEEQSKAVALVERSLKRICPHCKIEGGWSLRSQPGIESFVVTCNEYHCKKKFTILNSSNDMMTPLADILKELEVIRFRFGVLLVCLFVIPAIIGIILAVIHANSN